jgi:hypothetical protein
MSEAQLPPGAGDQDGESRLIAQLDLILGEGGVPGAVAYPENWRDVGQDYLSRAGHLLVRDEDVARVREVLDGAPIRERPQGLPGLTLFAFAGGMSVEAACRLVDSRLGAGIASPDHLLYLVPTGSTCPATEPESVHVPSRPYPEPFRSPQDGLGARIVILDSGLLSVKHTGQHDWLVGVTGDPEDPFVPNTGWLNSYASHGTFSAGVARTMAPGAEVFVDRTFIKYGTVFESDLVGQLVRTLRTPPDVISLSFGTHSRQDIPLLGIDMILPLLAQTKATVMVAAAGNDSTDRPFWPAAYPGIIGVGALGRNGDARAWFTNYGNWVDLYTPGEDLVNAFAIGSFVCVEPPNIGQQRHYHGMARWSGTSFSTPMFAGMITARMSATGETAPLAAAALVAQAQSQHIPGVGAVLTP